MPEQTEQKKQSFIKGSKPIHDLWFEITPYGTNMTGFMHAVNEAMTVQDKSILFRGIGPDEKVQNLKKEDVDAARNEVAFACQKIQGRLFYRLVWKPTKGTKLPLKVLVLTYGRIANNPALTDNPKLGIENVFFVVNQNVFYVFYTCLMEDQAPFGASLLSSTYEALYRKKKSEKG